MISRQRLWERVLPLLSRRRPESGLPPADFLRRRFRREVEGAVERLRYTVEALPGAGRRDVLDAEQLLAELDRIFRGVAV